MTYTIEELNDAKSKAMIILMTTPDSSFYTTLAFSMKYIWDETIPTACTDGTSVRLNPHFFMKQTPKARAGLLVHESCHVAYLHSIRCGDREFRRFNQAADHVINLPLLERGMELPPNGFYDRKFTGLSTEEVYLLLPPCPPEMDYPLQDLRPPTEEVDADIEAEVSEILVRAAIQSKLDNDKPGTIPGEIQIFLDNLLKPKLPWYHILRRYIQNMTKNDYSFRKPNRRYFPEHYLPTLYSEKVIDLDIAIDVSGSVTDEQFMQFVSEIVCIFRMMKPETINLIQFDAGIRSVTKLRNFQELIQCEFTGRGGTDISELVEWTNKKKSKLLLVFTDGDFRFYNEEIKSPVIWLIHNHKGFTPPYGKVIHYELSK